MAEKLININIANEMEKSFLDYSMSVIVSRAIPDVRDGLKPVQRRILFTMQGLGLYPDKSYKKSARIVGDALGRFHPHGDSAVYESLVRMAQPFSMRNMLVDGHGNFGSIDGDSAAAMRYTECKMGKIAIELLKDINKETVDFVDNFDGSEKEPSVLPSKFPNLLVNGATGIAVGMATNIPPHNLGEVISALVAYMENPDITTLEIMDYIKGPDFPTGATILGNAGIKKAYETGKGIIQVRAVAEIVDYKNRNAIIVSEIPYQVNKAVLIQRIAELVREKKLEGISDLRDESNRDGIKIVIELRREANANIVLNNLYKNTSLQSSFGINMLALSDGRPILMPIKLMLEKYLNHQKEIIVRRSRFDLNKATARLHLLEGFKIALDNIDEIIKIIKRAENDKSANAELITRFKLTEPQANAILEMKLRRLTGLERTKIETEYNDLLLLIDNLNKLLNSESMILDVIKEELLEIKNKYADDRRTKIDLTAIDYIEDESLIDNDAVVILLTSNGYVKRVLLDNYKVQNRGGVGAKGITTNEEDVVEKIINCKTHDSVYFFSTLGKVYRLKGYEVPEYSKAAKGLPIVNLIPLEKNEKISSILTISKQNEQEYLLFVTKKGIVKKTHIDEFESIRQSGKKAINLNEEDELTTVKLIGSDQNVVLASSEGKITIFNEGELRPLGRNSSGVRGIKLDNGDCIGAEVVSRTCEEAVLVLTANGYGKRTKISEYRKTKRGSKGVKALSITEKNGPMTTFKLVSDGEDIIVTTQNGMAIRINVNDIKLAGRVTQGVKIINLKNDNFVKSATIVQDQGDLLNEDDDVSRETSEQF